MGSREPRFRILGSGVGCMWVCFGSLGKYYGLWELRYTKKELELVILKNCHIARTLFSTAPCMLAAGATCNHPHALNMQDICYLQASNSEACSQREHLRSANLIGL